MKVSAEARRRVVGQAPWVGAIGVDHVDLVVAIAVRIKGDFGVVE